MAVILIFLNLILLFYGSVSLLSLKNAKTGQDYFFTNIREAYIITAIIYALFTFVQVYFLSSLDWLTFNGVLSTQLLLTLVISGYLVKRKFSLNLPGISFRTPEMKILLITVLFIVLPLFLLCILLPPNNSDSATCYLIRLEYWIKNHNIHHYPTLNLFELYYNQFPQFLIVSPRILSGSDYFTSVFQFFSYIGTAITVSLITREIAGKNFRMQFAAVIITLCIPQSILQSTAAMYDLQSAFAASVSVLYFLRIIKNSNSNFLFNSLVGSIAFAFTSYIKYSSVFFIIFFTIAIAVFLLRTDLKKFVSFSLIIVTTFLIIHGAFFLENYSSFGSIVAPVADSQGKLVNEAHSPSLITSVLIKNFALNLVSPLPAFNDLLYKSVNGIHDLMGVDINDRTVNLNEYYEKYSAAISESVSGNLFLTLLIIAAILIWIWKIIRKREFPVLISTYILCLIAGFILFGSIFKFQSWNARLQLPFFILSVAPVSALLSNVFSKKYFYYLLLGLIIFSALPFVYMNYNKPVISYFSIRKTFNKPPSVVNAVEMKLNGCDLEIGKYYANSSSSGFMQLKGGLTELEKTNVINVLDSSGYFANEKSIFEKTRNEMYLVPGYLNSRQLLISYEQVTHFLYSNGIRNVALVFGHAPEYPLMAMMHEAGKDYQINWSHVQFYSLNKENKNFDKKLNYEAIITNDTTLYAKTKSIVSSVKRFSLIDVILLQKPDTAFYRIALGSPENNHD